MKKILLSVVLGFVFGLPAVFVFVVAGEAFGAPGASSAKELFAGCLGVALYLAYCEFWVAPRASQGVGASAPTVLATVAPLALTLFLFERRAIADTGIPMVAAGLAGCIIGALAAERAFARSGVLTPEQTTGRIGYCNRLLLAGTLLLVAAPLVLGLGVIRPVASDSSSFADPRSASMGLWAIAGLNLLAAVPAVFGMLGTRGRGRFSAEVLGFPAVLALLLGVILLAPAVVYVAHGPGMHALAALLFLCAACDLVAAGVFTASNVVADRTVPQAA